VALGQQSAVNQHQLLITRKLGTNHFFMPAYAYLILVAGVVVWFTPFVPAHQKTGPAKLVNRRSRWGVLLQFAAFTLLWQGHFWERPLPVWRTSLCIALFAIAATLSWMSSHALGGQLRLDAGLGAEHKLVRSGPYALVRHPIYTSMLAVICATAVIVTPWPLFLAALALFIVGTEIRVRTEEKLLASQFGDEFEDYKREVPAYIPFLLLR
jgi:protein-S-isoprenylcysteine O-methyltransferase Ste14